MKKFLFNFCGILLLGIIFNVSSVLADSKITNITLGELNHIILEEGNTNKLEIEYTLTPSDATDKIVWESSNPSVAIVDENGVVTGLTKGKTIITASNEAKDVSVTIEIEVFEAKDVKIIDYNSNMILYSDGSLYVKGERNVDSDSGLNTYTNTYRYLDNNVVKSFYSYGDELFYLKNGVIYKYSLFYKNFEKIHENVLDFADNYIVTKNNKLYSYPYQYANLLLENVKSITSWRGAGDTRSIAILTLDKKLYVLGDNIYGKKINNNKKFDKPYLLFENVKEIDIEKQYILLNDGTLYIFSELSLSPQVVDTEVTDVKKVMGELIYEGKYFMYTKKGIQTIKQALINNQYQELNIKTVDGYGNSRVKLKKDGGLYNGPTLVDTDVKEIINTYGNKVYYLGNNNNIYILEDKNFYFIKSLYMENIDEVIEEMNLIRTQDGEYWYCSFHRDINYIYPDLIRRNSIFVHLKKIYFYGGNKRDITIGDTTNLLAVFLPNNATNKNVVWKVENEEYGTITKDGIFTATKVGTAKIIVMSEDKTVESYFEINIHPSISGIEYSGLTMYPTNAKMNGDDDYYYLLFKYSPSDALREPIFFENTNPKLFEIYDCYNNDCEMNDSIRIKPGINPGKAYIIVKDKNGNEIDKVLITIYERLKNIEEDEIIINLNEKNTYQIKLTPSDFPKELIKYDISDKLLGSVDQNGLITAFKSGKFKIDVFTDYIGDGRSLFKTIYVSVTSYVKPIFDKVKGIFNEAKKLIEKIDIGTTVKNLLDSIKNNDKVKIVDRNNNEVNGNQILKTGYRLYYLDSNSQYRSYTLSISGDVNEDGKISAMDYVKIKNHIMKTNLIVNNENLSAADFNNDGKISAMDYVKIKNYIMNGGK